MSAQGVAGPLAAVLLTGAILATSAAAAGPAVGPTGQYCWDDPNPAGVVTGYDLYETQTTGDSSGAKALTITPAAHVCVPRNDTGKANGQWYAGVAAHNAAGRSAFLEVPFVCTGCSPPTGLLNFAVQ